MCIDNGPTSSNTIYSIAYATDTLLSAPRKFLKALVEGSIGNVVYVVAQGLHADSKNDIEHRLRAVTRFLHRLPHGRS